MADNSAINDLSKNIAGKEFDKINKQFNEIFENRYEMNKQFDENFDNREEELQKLRDQVETIRRYYLDSKNNGIADIDDQRKIWRKNAIKMNLFFAVFAEKEDRTITAKTFKWEMMLQEKKECERKQTPKSGEIAKEYYNERIEQIVEIVAKLNTRFENRYDFSPLLSKLSKCKNIDETNQLVKEKNKEVTTLRDTVETIQEYYSKQLAAAKQMKETTADIEKQSKIWNEIDIKTSLFVAAFKKSRSSLYEQDDAIALQTFRSEMIMQEKKECERRLKTETDTNYKAYYTARMKEIEENLEKKNTQ